MKYAYIRVSSADQNLARQMDWARNVCPELGDDHIFADKLTGRNTDRPAYQKMKQSVQRGDEVYIKELDRLGRVKTETKDEVLWFKEKGVRLRIENIPTTLIDFGEQDWVFDMVNNVLLEVISAFAEQEWLTRKKRQEEGIAAAKSRDVQFGRPRAMRDDFSRFLHETKTGQMTVADACSVLNISRGTWYNWVKDEG